jgi:hypothetical protein
LASWSSRPKAGASVGDVVTRYNEIVEEVETDPSLKSNFANERDAGTAQPHHAGCAFPRHGAGNDRAALPPPQACATGSMIDASPAF